MLKSFIKKLSKPTTKKYSEPALMHAYARLPVSFVRGEGCKLWDPEGNEYLDALGGIAVTFLGHCHPKISETISLQANRLLHISNLFHIQEQARLGERFCQVSGMDKVFFGNSGAEANEAAIKIARLYARMKNIASPTIITANGSFHGRTMATISATGNDAIKEGFAPHLPGFIHVDYDDLEAIEQQANKPDVVAVMIEPIQGEAGVIVPSENYLKGIRSICDQHDCLMIVDEIQTGMGRTGKWFAHQHEAILPDVITSAKALGNGIPIGACAARGAAAELISPGSHGTTFGGNPFASQVAYSVIETIDNDNLIERAEEIGTYLKKQIQQKLGTISKVVDIRGKGLMLGIELNQAYPNLAMKFMAEGLVVNVTGGGKVVRLLPSALISEQQAKQTAEIMQSVISKLK